MFRFITLALAILLASIKLTYASDAYLIESIQAQDYSETREKLGVFSYLDDVTLAFKSSGYVDELSVEIGDRITPGQLLAGIDVTELVHQAQALTFRLEYAEKEQKRLFELYEKGLIPKARIESIESERNELNERLKQLTYLLINSNLHAEIEGVVTHRFVSKGELVSTGQPVMTIAPDKNNLMATFLLSNDEIENLEKNSKVQLYDNKHETTGSVFRLGVKTNANGLYQVDIKTDSNRFRSGANIKLKLELENHTVFPISHQTPIRISSNQATVLIKDNDEFSEKVLDIIGMDEALIYVRAETAIEDFVVNGWINR